MTGKRKMHGFYTTTLALVIMIISIVIAAVVRGWTIEVGSVLKTYIWAQTVVTGGFFGFNGVEHLALALAGKYKG